MNDIVVAVMAIVVLGAVVLAVFMEHSGPGKDEKENQNDAKKNE